jgi:hypothetical protein
MEKLLNDFVCRPTMLREAISTHQAWTSSMSRLPCL